MSALIRAKTSSGVVTPLLCGADGRLQLDANFDIRDLSHTQDAVVVYGDDTGTKRAIKVGSDGAVATTITGAGLALDATVTTVNTTVTSMHSTLGMTNNHLTGISGKLPGSLGTAAASASFATVGATVSNTPWNNVAVGIGEMSSSFTTHGYTKFSVIGTTSMATNVTIMRSSDNTTFYDTNVIVLGSPGAFYDDLPDFVAPYIKVKSSAAVTITLIVCSSA